MFRREVRRAGGKTIKLAPTEAGIPDRMVMWPGGCIQLVELKTERGRLSPIQVEWHKKAATLGIEVIVLYGANEIAEWISSS